MSQQLIDSLGLFGFFLASLLAATVLPLAIEAVVPVMVTQGFGTLGLVAAGTAGGYVGSLINYAIGSEGGERLEKQTSGRLARASAWIQQRFTRVGTPLLFFSWLPFLGEIITLAAGVARVNLWLFSFWTVVGRALRILGLIYISNWMF